MEYRKLPHGSEKEQFSTLGIGMGGIQKSPEREIEDTVRAAIEKGINFFDLCAGAANVYAPFGKAIAGQRDKVFFQMHFGAVYDEKGEYGWSRDLEAIKRTIEWELETLKTDYIDFGYLHCVDEMADFDKLASSGVFNWIQELHKKGVVHHIGFSSHTPSVAEHILDTGLIDMMMFSINAAYDFEKGDEYGIGTVSERAKLFRRCEADGIGISVMKPFHAGQLLDAKTSPFKTAMTKNQCLQYVLDRPGVLTVVPGVRGLADLKELLYFLEAAEEELDYSMVGNFTAENVAGHCVYCNHCQPCPAGINIGLLNKYYDLALAGDKLAANHYQKQVIKADACISCGHCNDRCPFGVAQSERMKDIAVYFNNIIDDRKMKN